MDRSTITTDVIGKNQHSCTLNSVFKMSPLQTFLPSRLTKRVIWLRLICSLLSGGDQWREVVPHAVFSLIVDGTLIKFILSPNPAYIQLNTILWLVVSGTVIPPNTADVGTGEKVAVFRKRRYWESYTITYKNLFGTWKWAAVLGGRRWVEGWYCIGRDDCIPIIS